MREALAEAKQKLGEGATILHSKPYEESLWLGLGRKQGVELLAAVDTPDTMWSQPAASFANTSGVSGVQSRNEGIEQDIGSVSRQIEEVKDLIARMQTESAPPPSPPRNEISTAVRRLIDNGVPRKLAETLLPDDMVKDKAHILNILMQRIRCSGQIDCSRGQARVALIGPTGAGKTTTAAKLAAQYSLVHKKSVAMLTLDTYRIGAVEQLATYARILNIPLEVALSPEDINGLIRKHNDKDLIIIDTVGRSQRNPNHILELARMLKPVRVTETHLVVPGSGSIAVQNEVVVSFSRLGADRLLISKLDECPEPGCVLHLAATSLLPFSYITYGQEVPDDIALANSEQLAKLVWEGRL